MKKADISFQVFVPDGNSTALVFSMETDANRRKSIQELILEQYADAHIEQVGFVTGNSERALLCMTGQEFCLNAVRCAAWHFLSGKPGELTVHVSGTDRPVHAGITNQLEVWSEAPVEPELEKIRSVEPGIFLAKMSGIVHLVVKENRTQSFLRAKYQLSAISDMLLRKNHLLDEPAAGVIFLEPSDQGLRLHPYIYVKADQRIHYETACGSGTMAAGMVMAAVRKHDVDICFIQPSQECLRALVHLEYPYVKQARVIGTVKSDDVVNTIAFRTL